jgi:glutamyl-tRNA synthetase
MNYFEELEARIPKGRVRTRFAPSPTGYMHVGNLRTALYTYFIARHAGGDFILRIEDTDQKRKVEDAVAVIQRTMAGCGLEYDEGPDIGGPVGPYVQTERKEIYQKYAELLVEKGAAYRCFCTEERLQALHQETNGGYDGHCRNLSPEEIQEKLDAGVPYVIRQRIPEGTTTFQDAVYGEISVDNSELDDQVLLKSDGLPTYNFANVVDDHLMGITHVVRGSEYLSSAPKYNLLYEAFGWEIPTYVHCASVMITDPETGAVRKMSKRHGDPSYEDLLNQGYLSEAIKNYVSLLGWSPRGDLAEQEFFDMEGLCSAFDIAGISKSPSAFDMEKLRYFNSTYLKNMTPEAFAEAAMPWIDKAITAPNVDKSQLPPLLQTRLDCLGDIPDMVSFFEALPEYDVALYTNKKNKLTAESSLELLQKEYALLSGLSDWSYDAIHDALYALTESEGIKIGKVMWPLRIAAAGKSVTPGGAIEIALILGREETLRRLELGLAKLRA